MNNKSKWLKILKTILFITVGGIIGYVYYLQVGCATGT